MSGRRDPRDGSAFGNEHAAGKPSAVGKDVDAIEARLELLEEALETGAPIDAGLVHELTSVLCADARARDGRPESALPTALCRRIDRALSLGHLRARETPEPLLARLTDDILEQTVIVEQAPAGSAEESARRADLRRAHMSRAFLDAPRSLHIWRATGMAACLLLGALTVVWSQSSWDRSSGAAERGSRERPLSPIRSQPLTRSDAASLAGSAEEEAARARRRFLGGALDRFSGMSRTVGDGVGARGRPADTGGPRASDGLVNPKSPALQDGGTTTRWGVERSVGSFPLNDTRSVERALRRLFPDAPVKARNDANDIEYN